MWVAHVAAGLPGATARVPVLIVSAACLAAAMGCGGPPHPPVRRCRCDRDRGVHGGPATDARRCSRRADGPPRHLPRRRTGRRDADPAPKGDGPRRHRATRRSPPHASSSGRRATARPARDHSCPSRPRRRGRCGPSRPAGGARARRARRRARPPRSPDGHRGTPAARPARGRACGRGAAHRDDSSCASCGPSPPRRRQRRAPIRTSVRSSPRARPTACASFSPQTRSPTCSIVSTSARRHPQGLPPWQRGRGAAGASRAPAPEARRDRGRTPQPLRPSGAGDAASPAGRRCRRVPDRSRRQRPRRALRARASCADACLGRSARSPRRVATAPPRAAAARRATRLAGCPPSSPPTWCTATITAASANVARACGPSPRPSRAAEAWRRSRAMRVRPRRWRWR